MTGQYVTISVFILTIWPQKYQFIYISCLCNFHKILEYTGVKMEWTAVAMLCVSNNDSQA